MRMTFFWTTDLGEFFFDGLNINSVTSLTILCVVIAVVAIVYEGIKVYSASARARTAREQIAAVSCAPSETANLLVANQNGSRSSFSRKLCKLLGEATIFLFHNSIGYAVMLSVMVYSGWLFLTVVLSMGLGYFLFGHISMKINMENVQARTTSYICSPACTEAGASSAIGSTNLSPCHSISQQVSEQQCNIQQQQHPAPSTSSNNGQNLPKTCTLAAVPPSSCHQENEMPKINTEVGEIEDCCCRL